MMLEKKSIKEMFSNHIWSFFLLLISFEKQRNLPWLKDFFFLKKCSIFLSLKENRRWFFSWSFDIQCILRIFVFQFVLYGYVVLRDRENDLPMPKVYGDQRLKRLNESICLTGFLNRYFHFEFSIDVQWLTVFVDLMCQLFSVILRPIEKRKDNHLQSRIFLR